MPQTANCSLDGIKDVYCDCIAPENHNIGNPICWGIMSMIFPGSAGSCCFGFCYGCDKPDCCYICWGSFLMTVTAPCIVGCFVSCVVGCKLLDIDTSKFTPKKEEKDQKNVPVKNQEAHADQ